MEYIAFNIDLSITLLVLIIMFICFLQMSIRLAHKMIELKKSINKYAELQKKRIDQSFNKFITLSPDELDKRLSTIFADQLELASATSVSEKDPNASVILYAKAFEGSIIFLGQKTIDAINYYYGDNYVIKWFETAYKILENRGLVSKIIQKEIYADVIRKELIH